MLVSQILTVQSAISNVININLSTSAVENILKIGRDALDANNHSAFKYGDLNIITNKYNDAECVKFSFFKEDGVVLTIIFTKGEATLTINF